MGNNFLSIVCGRVESATVGSYDLDADVYEALGYEVIRTPRFTRAGRGPAWRYKGHGPFGYENRWVSQSHFTKSVDAAMRLVPPRSSVMLDSAGWYASVEGHAGSGATAALALTSAALRCILAQDPTA